MFLPDGRILTADQSGLTCVWNEYIGQPIFEYKLSELHDEGFSFVIPFAYYEAAANLMTNAALDPVGKIPEFKYCAVAIRRGGAAAATAGYGAHAVNGGWLGAAEKP